MEILQKDKELGALKILNWSGGDIERVEGNRRKALVNRMLLALVTLN